MLPSDKLSVDIGKIQRPSLYDYMLQASSLPVFPFVKVNLKKGAKIQDFSVDLRVGSSLYEMLKTAYQSDQILLFASLVDGKIGIWTFDMIVGMKMLAKLKIIDDLDSWFKQARESISNILGNEQVDYRHTECE